MNKKKYSKDFILEIVKARISDSKSIEELTTLYGLDAVTNFAFRENIK